MGSEYDIELDSILSKRYSCFRALNNQPRPKCELEDEIDCSRSTLDRTLRELEDANLVRYENGVWTPTLLGQYSYQCRKEYIGCLRKAENIAPFLENLPFENPINYDLLVNSEIHKVDTTKPNTVVQTFLDCIEQGSEIHIATSKFVTDFMNTLREYSICEKCDSVEMIVQSEIFENISKTFPILTEEVVDNSSLQLGRTSVPFSYGLWIIDSSQIGIILVNKQGKYGLLINNTNDAVNWATDQYYQIKQNTEFKLPN